MSFNSFIQSLDQRLKHFLSFLMSEKYQVTLVGGLVRDIILESKVSFDIDIEIQTNENLDEIKWIEKIEELAQKITQKGYAVEILPYSILRVIVGDYFIEISGPRKEIYSVDLKTFSHNDFKANLFSKLDAKDSFVRRDFTMNAIGLKLDENFNVEIIDPFEGLSDLKNKVLRPCNNDDFYKDPVRLLRLIRFKSKYSLRLDLELEKNLSCFDLRALTCFLFLQEAKKEDFFLFFENFFDFLAKYKIECSQTILDFKFFISDIDLKTTRPKIYSFEDLASYYILNSKKNNKDLLAHFDLILDYIPLKKTFITMVLSIKNTLLNINENPDLFIENLKKILDLDFLEIKDSVELILVDDLYQVMRRLAQVFPKIEDFFDLRLKKTFMFFYNLLYLRQLQGQKAFESFLTKHSLDKNDYSRLRLYCHLKEVL